MELRGQGRSQIEFGNEGKRGAEAEGGTLEKMAGAKVSKVAKGCGVGGICDLLRGYAQAYR